ncbi:MAG: chemotaxis-specific protein-glutamate methyltransferase CheB [Nitrospirae bacterium]|nr:chemotaxis-specific protein-glutamate methyltransferase CheB [Nitrospirota bacterium]
MARGSDGTIAGERAKRDIRVLIVDDSEFAREMLAGILSMDDEIHVAGQAVNGLDAITKVRELSPDIVTMDIEMPVMNGIDAIEKIMAATPVPIVVITSLDDVDTAYRAISKGALDVFHKPGFDEEKAKSFIQKIKLLSRYRLTWKNNERTRADAALPDARRPGTTAVYGENNNRRIIAIASSTGGPKALSIILPYLPASLPCPVVIAQHISHGFVSGLTDWLKTICKINIKVAEKGESLQPATAYVSPSEWNMGITSDKTVDLKAGQQSDIYHPSCDVLLFSAAVTFRENTIGIILSGMGSDGAAGMKKIRDSGGTTIAQDEATSVVFGMNKVAIDDGAIGKVMPVTGIGKEILSILKMI